MPLLAADPGGTAPLWHLLGLSALPLIYHPVAFRLGRGGSYIARRVVLSLAMLGFAAAMLWLGPCDAWWPEGTCLAGEESSGVAHGLLWGLLLVALVSCVFGVIAAVPRWAERFRDERFRRLRPWEARLSGPLILLGTALPEEVIFRGVLFSAWYQTHGLPLAVLMTSLAFGLWHIAPELERVRGDPGRTGAPGGIAAGIALTTVAGAGFALLRHWTGAIWLGVALHAAVNISALLTSRARPRPSGAT